MMALVFGVFPVSNIHVGVIHDSELGQGIHKQGTGKPYSK